MKEKRINVKVSEYHEIMKELNINDLNDLLIKEYIDPVDRLMDWSKGSKEMERQKRAYAFFFYIWKRKGKLAYLGYLWYNERVDIQ